MGGIEVLAGPERASLASPASAHVFSPTLAEAISWVRIRLTEAAARPREDAVAAVAYLQAWSKAMTALEQEADTVLWEVMHLPWTDDPQEREKQELALVRRIDQLLLGGQLRPLLADAASRLASCITTLSTDSLRFFGTVDPSADQKGLLARLSSQLAELEQFHDDLADNRGVRGRAHSPVLQFILSLRTLLLQGRVEEAAEEVSRQAFYGGQPPNVGQRDQDLDRLVEDLKAATG